VEDLQAVAKMPAYELAAGIEGGVPGVDFDPAAAALAVKGGAADKTADKADPKAPPADAVAAEEPATETPPEPKVSKSKADKAAKASADIAEALSRFPAAGMPVPSNVPLFKVLDKDKDGKISKAEIETLPPGVQKDTVDRLLNSESKK
jgi:hypothetical protein